MSGPVVQFLVVVEPEVQLDIYFNLHKTTEKHVQDIAPELNHVIQSNVRNQVKYFNLYFFYNQADYDPYCINIMTHI